MPLAEANVALLTKSDTTILSVREACEPSPNLLIPPGLYRGTRTLERQTNEIHYKLRLSTFSKEQDVDVTALVFSGKIADQG